MPTAAGGGLMPFMSIPAGAVNGVSPADATGSATTSLAPASPAPAAGPGPPHAPGASAASPRATAQARCGARAMVRRHLTDRAGCNKRATERTTGEPAHHHTPISTLPAVLRLPVRVAVALALAGGLLAA